ncbi:MAG TPA: radical SAM protein [Anaerolineae bacterium]|nr:radical SAM protein [Anaerolineae bacterium]HNU02686.1 radical SAM protein [Anaerolineae bacterium]
MTPPELLLISPPDYQTREFRGAQPLGIAYLAAALRAAGIASQLLDANLGGPTPLEPLTQQLNRFVAGVRQAGGRPVVGISMVSQVTATVAELAERIKRADPETLVIVGGYHPTFADREILEDFPAIDLCVRGEGEQTIVELMQHWQEAAAGPADLGRQGVASIDWGHILGVTWRQGAEIVVNPSRPNNTALDALPFPARDLLPPLQAYAPYADTVAGKMRLKASMISSRGCPFHCNFCAIIAFYGDAGGMAWRGRSVDNVVAEMIELAERDGASHFEFQDDNFFVQPKRALAIVQQYAATGRDFSFAFLTRPDQVVKGERYFPALRQAGLRYVSVGIESGSDASLVRMVKQTGVEINRRALEILHNNDVAAQVEFIMFEPGSLLEDLQANLHFIEQQGLFGYFPPLVFTCLLLMPGTPARSQMELERGLSGNIHQVLPYEFIDPQVTEVFQLLDEFRSRLGDRWYELAFRLLDGLPALEISLQQEQVPAALSLDPRRLAQLKLEFFALTRIPYQLLRDGLDLAARGQHLAGQPELLSRAEAELAEVSSRVQLLLPRAP